MVVRDVTNANNERTAICTIIPTVGIKQPLNIVITNNVLDAVMVLANVNSLVVDFIARQRFVGRHLNVTTFNQLPFPSCNINSSNNNFVSPRVLELVFFHEDLRDFAQDLGYFGEPFSFDPDRRHQLKCELDAYYAKLYGLTRDELRYILDPSDIMGEDYPSETFRVLKNKEMNEFGEYRTQRLVLEAWDELSATETIKKAAPVAEFSLYPDTDADRAICAVALALVQQTGGMGSMDHLDALILAARPQLSKVFLSKSEHHFLDAALASSPKALWSDNRLNIRWKECRDHLESRKAIYIRHGLKDQPIEVGSELPTVQASFPGHVAEIASVALKALAKVKELRKSGVAATPEQAKTLNIFDDQHRAYQLVA